MKQNLLSYRSLSRTLLSIAQCPDLRESEEFGLPYQNLFFLVAHWGFFFFFWPKLIIGH